MLKNLWVMRHGQAEGFMDTDFNRALTSRGQQQVEDVIQQLISDPENEIKPSDMLASPFVRTQQTAKIAYDLLNIQTPLETEEMLVHSASEKVLGDYLLACDYENLIIVSHMPIVACLCHYLSPNIKIMGFSTAQIVQLSFNSERKACMTKSYLPRFC
jgi:phosphohistidine phosphatase